MSPPHDLRIHRRSRPRRVATVLAAVSLVFAGLAVAPGPAEATQYYTVYYYKGSGYHESATHLVGPNFKMYVHLTDCKGGQTIFVWNPTRQTDPPPGQVGLLRPWWQQEGSAHHVYSKYSAEKQHIRYRFENPYCSYIVRIVQPYSSHGS